MLQLVSKRLLKTFTRCIRHATLRADELTEMSCRTQIDKPSPSFLCLKFVSRLGAYS
jgi:hypothetical protein